MTSFHEAVSDLNSRVIMPDRAPSLAPMQEGLQRLNLSIQPERVILVAGTNGKGTVAKALEQLLQNAGKRCGLYTSPHLIRIQERIRINNEDVSADLFTQGYECVRATTEGLTLSHFEMLTLMACWCFFHPSSNSAPVDWAIFEVGMGGTWDATNAIAHQWSIITRLGFDHEHLLGPGLKNISSNKFGIVPRGGRVFYHPFPNKEISDLAKSVQEKTQSHWTPTAEHHWSVTSGREPTYILHSPWGKVQLPLPGRRAAENIMLALTAFQGFGFHPQSHLRALTEMTWPGRMSPGPKTAKGSRVYFSGDHNEAGIESLIEILKDFTYDHLYFLIGIGKSKDKETMLKQLKDVPRSEIHLTKTPFMGAEKADYGPWLQKAESFDEDPYQALKTLKDKASPDDMIVVTGSLYLVGDLLAAHSPNR